MSTKRPNMKEIKYFEDNCFHTDSILEPSFFEEGEFLSCKFEGIDLSGSSFNHSKFIECIFDRCNLSNISLHGTALRDATFINSKLVGVNFSNCNSLFQLTFQECILDYSVFQRVKVTQFQALKSSLKEADLTESMLLGSSFSDCNLENALFTASDLTGSDFRGALNYFIDPQHTKVKKSKFSMPEAMQLLSAFEIQVE